MGREPETNKTVQAEEHKEAFRRSFEDLLYKVVRRALLETLTAVLKEIEEKPPEERIRALNLFISHIKEELKL